MIPANDVKHINPFLHSSITIVETVTQVKMTVGKPLGIIIDITPPLAVYGNDLQLKSDIDGIKVPLMYGGEEYIGLYICVYEDK